jgi:flagellin
VGQGSDGLASAVNAFNQQSARTGVIAQDDAVTGGIRLTNTAGDTIGLQAETNMTGVTVRAYDPSGNLSTAQAVSDTSMTETVGTVTLNSASSFSVTETAGRELGGVALPSASQMNAVSTISISTFEDAQRSIATIDSALSAITAEQARYGAIQNRFENTINNLMVGSENTASAKSRVMDADYAQEVTNRSRAMILQQVGVTMQAQANQTSELVLSLLR